MTVPDPLDNVSIVLVNTKTPANIGAVARGMMNMGLSRLILVRPPEDPNDDALKLAAGAGRVLHEAKQFGTLCEAVAAFGAVDGMLKAKVPDTEADPPLRVEEASVCP